MRRTTMVRPAVRAVLVTLVAALGTGAALAGVAGAQQAARPVAVDGGWAYPGRYVVSFAPAAPTGEGSPVAPGVAPDDPARAAAVLAPLSPRTYGPVGTGTYLVVFDDLDTTSMTRRLAQLRALAGVRQVDLDWLVRPGEQVDLPVDPAQASLGSGYDPRTAPAGPPSSLAPPTTAPGPGGPPATPVPGPSSSTTSPPSATSVPGDCCGPQPEGHRGPPSWLLPSMAAVVVALGAALVVVRRRRDCADADAGHGGDMDERAAGAPAGRDQ